MVNQEMESLKTKNQVLKSEKEKSESKHETEMVSVIEKQNKELNANYMEVNYLYRVLLLLLLLFFFIS
jgi:hypothetical protein